MGLQIRLCQPGGRLVQATDFQRETGCRASAPHHRLEQSPGGQIDPAQAVECHPAQGAVLNPHQQVVLQALTYARQVGANLQAVGPQRLSRTDARQHQQLR